MSFFAGAGRIEKRLLVPVQTILSRAADVEQGRHQEQQQYRHADVDEDEVVRR